MIIDLFAGPEIDNKFTKMSLKTEAEPISIYFDKNIFCTSDYTLISHDGQIKQMGRGSDHKYKFLSNSLMKKDIENWPGVYFVVGNIYYKNIWHFTSQVFGSLLIAKKYGIDLNSLTVVCNNIKELEILSEYFNLLEIVRYKIVPNDKIVLLENAYYTNQSIILETAHKDLLDAFEEFKFNITKKVSKVVNGKRFYISRCDALRRRILNEDKLTSMMERYNIKTVVLSHYNLLERICMFSDAELLISAHAAGMAMMYFLPKDSSIIELISCNCKWNFVPNFAIEKHIKYAGIVGKPVSSDVNADYEVNIDILEDILHNKKYTYIDSKLKHTSINLNIKNVLEEFIQGQNINMKISYLIRIQEFEKAKELLKGDIIKNTFDSELYCKLGELYEHTSDWVKAEENYKKAMSCDDKSYMYIKIYIEFLIRTEQYDKAVNVAHDSFKRLNDANFLYFLSKIYIIYKNYQTALDYIDKAIYLQNNIVKFYLLKADICIQLNKFSECKECCEFALSINKMDYLALTKLGDMYKIIKNYDLAEQYYTTVLSYKPKLVSVYQKISEILIIRKEYDSVLHNAEQALSINKNLLWAYNDMYISYYSKNDLKNAERYLYKCIELKPEWVSYREKLLTILVKMDKQEEALKNCQAALEINSSLKWANRYLKSICKIHK